MAAPRPKVIPPKKKERTRASEEQAIEVAAHFAKTKDWGAFIWQLEEALTRLGKYSAKPKQMFISKLLEQLQPMDNFKGMILQEIVAQQDKEIRELKKKLKELEEITLGKEEK